MDFQKLTQFSYAPYSGKRQACVVASDTGAYYPGVRIENISFPLTIGRIQAAVFSCLADQETPKTLYLPDQADTGELLSFWQSAFDLKVITDPDFTFESKSLAVPKSETGQSITYSYLIELCGKAVIPNSSFPVAAMLEAGEYFMPGVNMETSAWELGLCAERIALSRAIAAGFSQHELGKMFIAAPKGDYVSPCGACRQLLMEHIPAKPVILFQNATETLTIASDHLMPYHFATDKLGSTPDKP
ncbi:cytidine deaminase, homotetrameric [Cyclonatronum proteinivorum]|uniref:Cytidine deaminase, homotetrameric n=1 Tax=Cyclonatronum proteinivorum TaxID=1457365 RepID=A0A345ULB2_9BACT|nr:hypothetical protein [Cyclonatronum proteinivorum]AXJ01264.1 cytidine deaminase, homotetrameric [Cyclonatronum proteinivorum]